MRTCLCVWSIEQSDYSIIIIAVCHALWRLHFAVFMSNQRQPFNGRLSGTARVGRYQKKHSPAHTHPGQRTSFITFLHLQRSMVSSLFMEYIRSILIIYFITRFYTVSIYSLCWPLCLSPQHITLSVVSPTESITLMHYAYCQGCRVQFIPTKVPLSTSQ